MDLYSFDKTHDACLTCAAVTPARARQLNILIVFLCEVNTDSIMVRTDRSHRREQQTEATDTFNRILKLTGREDDIRAPP